MPPVFNPDRPHGLVYGDDEVAYEQGYCFFDAQGNFLREDPNKPKAPARGKTMAANDKLEAIFGGDE